MHWKKNERLYLVLAIIVIAIVLSVYVFTLTNPSANNSSKTNFATFSQTCATSCLTAQVLNTYPTNWCEMEGVVNHTLVSCYNESVVDGLTPTCTVNFFNQTTTFGINSGDTPCR